MPELGKLLARVLICRSGAPHTNKHSNEPPNRTNHGPPRPRFFNAPPVATVFPCAESLLCSARPPGSLKVSPQLYSLFPIHHSHQRYQRLLRPNPGYRSSAGGRRRSHSRAWRRRRGRRAGARAASRNRLSPYRRASLTIILRGRRMASGCRARSHKSRGGFP